MAAGRFEWSKDPRNNPIEVGSATSSGRSRTGSDPTDKCRSAWFAERSVLARDWVIGAGPRFWATRRPAQLRDDQAMSNMDTPPVFDDFAEDFERHAAENAYNAWYDRPAVLKLIGEVAGRRVLDAGCGPGLYAEQLVARGAEVVAFDHSPKMVGLARSRLGERAMVRVHNLADPLDWLEDDSFDVALLALVIHHLDDRVSALREIHRVVLRPGAYLVVSTHHPTGDWLRQGGSYFAIEPIEETWSRGWRVRYWRLPLTTTSDEFTQAGFVIERLVEPQPAPEMAERYPDAYEKLNREPGFINFRLSKPS